MNLVEKFYENKELIGKIFFIISMILLLSLFIQPLNNFYTNIDDRFTVFLIQMPLEDCWNLIIHDVHPPVYYFILRISCNILSLLHIPYDIIFVCKLLSILPLILLTIISVTKLRKEYNWFTVGLFMLSLTTMGDFIVSYGTVRMYSWALLIIVLIFIYYKDLIERKDNKSWIIFMLLCVIGAYTHYMLVVTMVLIYLALICYSKYIEDPNEKVSFIKKWILSVVASIFLYIPGFYILYNQLLLPHTNNAQNSGVYGIITCLTSFANSNTDVTINTLILKLIVIVLLSLVFFISLKKFLENRNVENYYIFSGVLIYLMTFFISAVVMPLLFSPLIARYLIPVFGLFWLVIAICVNNIESPHLTAYLIILILLLAGTSCVNAYYQIDNLYNISVNETNALSEINNDNSVIIYSSPWYYYTYHNDLKNTHEYALKNFEIVPSERYGYTVSKSIEDIMEENEGKNFYVIKGIHKDKDKKIENYTSTKTFNRGPNWIIQISDN